MQTTYATVTECTKVIDCREVMTPKSLFTVDRRLGTDLFLRETSGVRAVSSTSCVLDVLDNHVCAHAPRDTPAARMVATAVATGEKRSIGSPLCHGTTGASATRRT
jgi:hypothetical protein